MTGDSGLKGGLPATGGRIGPSIRIPRRFSTLRPICAPTVVTADREILVGPRGPCLLQSRVRPRLERQAAPRRNTVAIIGGATSVVTITIATIAENVSAENSGVPETIADNPTPAKISPTSPRGIMLTATAHRFSRRSTMSFGAGFW